MKKVLLALGIIILLSLNCCFRPYPIYDLNPSGDYTTRWLFGCEYVIMKNADVITSLAFVNSERDMLNFDLEVINRSADNILIAPELFYYYPLDSKTFSDTTAISAIDPELQINRIDKVISNKRAYLSNQALTNIMVESTDLIGDIIEFDQRSLEEKQLDSQEDLKRQLEQQKEESRTKSQIDNLTFKRKYWSTEVLRKTTLQQNQSIQGKLYFPTEKDIKKIKVVLNIGDRQFEILFDQSRF